jgi:23S rRNA pseudouridine2605 synthase
VTELELQHLRREKWRVDGEPLRTLEDAREFVDSVGICLMYPIRPTPVLPTFIAAFVGSDAKLPERKTAFSDPRASQAEELVWRLLRQKTAFPAQFSGEMLIVSSESFPYLYALASDRQPKKPIHSRTRDKASPLTEHAFRKLEEGGPLTRAQLQEQLGGALSEAGLDRGLQELWTALKITPTDHAPETGYTWNTYYHWATDAVNEGVRLSDAEALSALISKYLEAVIAATQEEIEGVFSAFTSRARVAEVVRALLAAREFAYTPSETRTLITVAHTPSRSTPQPARTELGSRPDVLRRRNG